MTFTDDDLKWLKRIADRDRYLNSIKLPQLIARLEASEEFAEGAALAYPSLKLGDSYKAWREVSGK